MKLGGSYMQHKCQCGCKDRKQEESECTLHRVGNNTVFYFHDDKKETSTYQAINKTKWDYSCNCGE